jgi:TDG/mug DNA glycosylase family protein
VNRGVKRRLRDRIEPGVRVLFVGINPGVRSALTGHHFAGFSNRFWRLPTSRGSCRNPSPTKTTTVCQWGFGHQRRGRAPGIDTLRPQGIEGTRTLLRKVNRYRPCRLALIGVTVWRAVLDGTWRSIVEDAPCDVGLADTRRARPEC